jgi:hypothetical protein
VSSLYDEFGVRVPIISTSSATNCGVTIRDRPEHYLGPRGHDRSILIAVGAHPRLYLVTEEAEALHTALARWRERRAALRPDPPVSGEAER